MKENIKSVLFMILLFSASQAYSGEIDKIYQSVVKGCDQSSTKFVEGLDKIDKAISEYKAKEDGTKIYKDIKSGTDDGYIILYLGAYAIAPESRDYNIPDDSCWLYYNRFMKSLKDKDQKQAESFISDWHVCHKGLAGEVPSIVKDIISCYEKTKK